MMKAMSRPHCAVLVALALYQPCTDIGPGAGTDTRSDGCGTRNADGEGRA